MSEKLGFHRPVFNAHFEVSHEKRVMEMPNFKYKSLNSHKKNVCSLEVVFVL